MRENKSTAKHKKAKTYRAAAPKKEIVTEAYPQINNYFEKYGLYIFLFLLLANIIFVFSDFIFLNKIYLFKDIGSDSINANYPRMVQVARYISDVSFIPKWSFQQGMGQNILPFAFPDPFYFILLLSGPNNLIYGIGYMEIAKIITAGILFYFFLKKITASPYATIVGGLLYAFSGFVILGSCWTIFSTEAVYLALLLYAFETFYQNNKIVLLPPAICLIAINQPFDLLLMGVFLVAYILFRYLSENVFDIKKISLIFFKVAGLAFLGILMSSFFFIPDVIQMLESPRGTGESSHFSRLLATPVLSLGDKLHNVTALMRLFSTDILGTGSDYTGWYNYLEAPLFYIGVITLLLFTQVFPYLNRQKKLIYASFLLLYLLPVVFPFFRYSFWFFTGDYYRLFGFFLSVILLIFSVTGLGLIDGKFKINFLALGSTVLVLLTLLLRNYFPDAEVINEEVKNKAVLFLFIYAILIALLAAKKFKNIIKVILLLMISIELVSFANYTINKRPVIEVAELKQKTGYNDYSVEAIAYLKARDSSFFRVAKDYSSGPAIHSSINDAQVQNFYGTPSYTSFNQLNYIQFLQELNIVNAKNETETRWAPGLTNTPLLHSFGSIKYALSKKQMPDFVNFNYDSVTTVGDVRILKNKTFLPIGFTYEKFLSKKDFQKLSQVQKMISLYKAVVVDDSLYRNFTGIAKFPLQDTSVNYSWQENENDISFLKADTLAITTFNQNSITGRIKLEKQKLLFFSIPFDEGWQIKINDKVVNPMMVNIGFTGVLINAGDHYVSLSFVPRFYKMSAIISVIAILLFIGLVIFKYMTDINKLTIRKLPFDENKQM
jgi:uncharacterized membrane protein YfhO